jgi:hypothetical protein
LYQINKTEITGKPKTGLESRHKINQMPKKKILKSTQNKLAKAVDVLKSFSTGVVQGNDIILNDLYLVNDTDNPVTFTILFNNVGVATSTDVFLDNNLLKEKILGSITDFPVGTNKSVAGKFLKIFSAILVTPLTPVPDDLKVDFSISGGASNVSYPLPSFKISAAGDKVNLDISIFFLHV